MDIFPLNGVVLLASVFSDSFIREQGLCYRFGFSLRMGEGYRYGGVTVKNLCYKIHKY